MRLLAFDPSQTRTGWALFGEGGPVDYGHFDYPSWGDREPVFIDRFHRDVTELVQKAKATVMVYEGTFIPRGKSRRPIDTFAGRFAQLSLVTIIMLVAEQNGLPVSQVGISDWRKRFIGTSRSPTELTGSKSTKWFKDKAIETCNKRGWSTVEPDEAEALGIGDYAMCCKMQSYKEMTDEIATNQRDLFR